MSTVPGCDVTTVQQHYKGSTSTNGKCFFSLKKKMFEQKKNQKQKKVEKCYKQMEKFSNDILKCKNQT